MWFWFYFFIVFIVFNWLFLCFIDSMGIELFIVGCLVGVIVFVIFVLFLDIMVCGIVFYIVLLM